MTRSAANDRLGSDEADRSQPSADARRALFGQLLIRELRERVAAGDTPSREDYETSFPDFAEQIAEVFQGGDLGASPKAFAAREFQGGVQGGTSGVFDGRVPDGANQDTPFADSERATQLPASFGDYELLEEIARGGMGVVYKARQVSLNRIVALKMILAGALASQREVQRFRTEAEAAAKLDHPGIVPIYEVSRHAGHYFYSMAYVPGQSLAQRLAAGPLPPRIAAGIVKQVAAAVAYAHEQGVIHRDLKPANILLAAAVGRRLETGGRNQKSPGDSSSSALQPPVSSLSPRITDFGLAKQVESDSRLTQSGQIVGTPSYMPPEQAAGNVAEIGPRADVYALGATLYALVTARPPFQAASVGETLRQVQEQEPVPPRRLNAAIDKDLETICLKCLQKDPGQRYATAAEVAADLGRFSQHLPILARPISRPTRLFRWCRRNPRLSFLTAALILALVSGTIISSYFAVRATENAEYFRQEKERADGETEKAKEALGERNAAIEKQKAALEETEKAIHDYVSTIKNSELLKDARHNDLLESLLKGALNHYQHFVDQHHADSDYETRSKVADALIELAWHASRTGSAEDAIAVYRRSLNLREELAKIYPDEIRNLRGMALVHWLLGNELGTIARSDDALAAYQEALRLYEHLSTRESASIDDQRGVAELLNAIGGLYWTTDRMAEALTARSDALSMYEKLNQLYPDDVSCQLGMARTHMTLGLTLEQDSPDKALASYKAALEIVDRVITKDPSAERLRDEFADVDEFMGSIYEREGHFDEALASYQKSLLAAARLAAQNPTNSTYMASWAISYQGLGNFWLRQGRPDNALSTYQPALPIFQRCVDENPNDVGLLFNFANCQANVAKAFDQTGELETTLDALQAALAIYQRLCDKSPSDTRYLGGQAAALQHVGELHARLGRHDASLEAFHKMQAIAEQLTHEHPTNVTYQGGLAHLLNLIGQQYALIDDPTKAKESHQAALAQYERLAGNEASDVMIVGVATCEIFLAELSIIENPPEARELLRRALERLNQVLQREPNDQLARWHSRKALQISAEICDDAQEHQLAAAEWERALKLDDGELRELFTIRLGLSLAKSGDADRAIEVATTLAETKSGEILYNVACIYSICSNAVAGDKSIDETARGSIVEGYAVNATAFLKKAADNGFFTTPEATQTLQQDTDLDPLRMREDFRELLRSVVDASTTSR